MFDGMAVETHQAPGNRGQIKCCFGAVFPGEVQAQLPPLALLPVGVQIKNNRKLPGMGMAENIEVAFIETALRVYCQMKFHIPDTEIAGAIEILNQALQLFEEKNKGIRRAVVVNPVDMIPPDILIHPIILPFAYSGGIEMASLIMAGYGLLYLPGFRRREKTVGNGITSGKDPFDNGFKNSFVRLDMQFHQVH